MPVTLSDVMRETSTAEFQPDVQLVQYRSPKNLELLRHYIFTYIAPQRKYSTIVLLHRFAEALGPAARENRLVVIATYGHGKSHFALALANYFGKPMDSLEARVALSSIRHAIPAADLGTYGFLEDFRKNHRPYLVLILRGDDGVDLLTKFYRAVKEALVEERDGAEDAPLPFWLGAAEDFLLRIPPALHDQTNAFLRRFSLDLDALLQRVRDGEAETHDICVVLHQELYGPRPNFDQGLSLKDAIAWLVRNKCSADGPYAGVLVLFDEFSTFIEQYGHSILAGTPLQDLLNGVSDHPGQVEFIAFAQQDPNEVAERTSVGEVQNRIIKELGRLPPNYRYQLHSSLEEVLESYLRKDGDTWLNLLQDGSSFAQGLDAATTEALRLYKSRYLDELQWGIEHFHRLVTLGCYPLHPLTTALLCSVNLKMTPGARPVLGFVETQLRDRLAQPVETEGGPNWIRPVALVDYFREMLNGNNHEWERYQDALAQIHLADEPNEALVLQSMLLHAVANLTADRYERTITELSGLSEAEAMASLAVLARRGVIRQDPVRGTYSLPPVGWGRGGELLIEQKKRGINLNDATLASIDRDLVDAAFAPVGVSVEWGNPEDWVFSQALVVKDMVTDVYLKGVASKRLNWTLDGDGKERPRGFVVWPLATDETDLAWYRDHVAKLLSDAFPDGSVPLVVMRPNQPSTLVIDRLKRYLALKGFSAQEKSQVGIDWHKNALDQVLKELRSAFDSFKEAATPEVPPAIRAQLNWAAPLNLSDTLRQVTQLAYPYNPRTWFKEYRQQRLATPAAHVASVLLQGGRLDPAPLANGPDRKIATDYLRPAWQVVDAGYHVVEPPTESPVRAAWAELDSYFAPGGPSKPIKTVLQTLLNAPYGYDLNTVTLLFAAWRAFHRSDSELIGPSINLAANLPLKSLLQALASSNLRRADLRKRRGEISDLVQRVRGGARFIRKEAHDAVGKLDEFQKLGGEEDAFQQQAAEAVQRLKTGLDAAWRYDDAAQKIRLAAGDLHPKLDALLQSLAAISKLPTMTCVSHEEDPPEVLRSLVMASIQQQVSIFCEKESQLQRLEDYGINQSRLLGLKRSLDTNNLANLLPRVDAALAQLDFARNQLRGRAARNEQLIAVRGMPVSGPMTLLRRFLEQLVAIDPIDEDVGAAKAAKVAQIHRELERLEALPSSFSVRLDQSATPRDVVNVRNEALGARALCDEGDARAALQRVIERADRVEGYFAELERLGQQGRSRPDEFARDLERLEHLAAQARSYLSDRQRDAADVVAGRIRTALEAQRTRVLGLLERLRADLDRGVDAERLQRELDRSEGVWAFLPDEARSALEKLRADIQAAIERERAARDEEQRRAAELQRARELIAGVGSKGPMSQLRQSLARLEELIPPPELKAAKEMKRAEIASALARLEARPGQLLQQLDAATNRSEVEKCRDAAIRVQDQCDEPEPRRQLEGVVRRCEALREYLATLERTRQQPRSQPSDYDRAAEQLRALEDERAEALGPGQRGLAEELMAALESERAAKHRSAFQRLQDLQRRVDEGPAAKVEEEIEKTDWSFLSSEADAELAELKQRVQSILDGDEAEQVRLHFQKIRDPEQRRFCLEALQRLVEERV